MSLLFLLTNLRMASQGHENGGFGSLIFLIIVILVLYALIIRPIMKKSKGRTDECQNKSTPRDKSEKLEYYQEEELPKSPGRCSDNLCPCNDTILQRGKGYLFVSEQAAEFRKDARTLKKAEKKIAKMQKSNPSLILDMLMDRSCVNGILICRKAAKLRGINLEVAAADACYYWETGKIPIRPTPLEVAKQS